MIMHDCRQDEFYNQKYVEGKNKEFLDGFDWATEQAVDNFFDNDMAGLQDVDSYLGHLLCEKVPEHLRESYVMERTFGDDEDRRVETYADLIRFKMLEWLETARNELIVSMIDDLDEDVYNAIKERVDGEQGKKSD